MHLSFLQVEMRRAVKEKLTAQYHSLPEETSAVEEEEDASSAIEEACSDDPEEGTSAGSNEPKCKKICLLTLFGEGYGVDKSAECDKLERYWRENGIPPEDNPLEWWSGKKRSFPKLYKLATRYLCVLATSMPAERLFSAAGLIVNRLRSRLSLEHVDMLIALNKNAEPEPTDESE